jgi:hypothetical protein
MHRLDNMADHFTALPCDIRRRAGQRGSLPCIVPAMACEYA